MLHEILAKFINNTCTLSIVLCLKKHIIRNSVVPQLVLLQSLCLVIAGGEEAATFRNFCCLCRLLPLHLSLQPTSQNSKHWRCSFTRLIPLSNLTILISNFRLALNIVCFLLGNSPASEVCMPTFHNTLFHLHRQVGVYTHTYLPMKME